MTIISSLFQLKTDLDFIMVFITKDSESPFKAVWDYPSSFASLYSYESFSRWGILVIGFTIFFSLKDDSLSKDLFYKIGSFESGILLNFEAPCKFKSSLSAFSVFLLVLRASSFTVSIDWIYLKWLSVGVLDLITGFFGAGFFLSLFSILKGWIC